MIDDLVELKPHLAQNLLLQKFLIAWAGIRIAHIVMEHKLPLLPSERIRKHLDFVGNDDDFFQIYIPYRNVLSENDFSVFVPNLEITNFAQFFEIVCFELG